MGIPGWFHEILELPGRYEGEVGHNIPEIGDAEQGHVVGKVVILRSLGDRSPGEKCRDKECRHTSGNQVRFTAAPAGGSFRSGCFPHLKPDGLVTTCAMAK